MALSFAREGCTRIAIADRDIPGLKETGKLLEEIEENVVILIVDTVGDVQDERSVERMVNGAVALWGRVDYGVNCAGWFPSLFSCHYLSLRI